MDSYIPIYKIESSYVSNIYNSGKWVDGVNIKKLKQTISKYLNVKYVILTNSGTSALLAAYWAMKDSFSKLYVDPYTFPATYQPARILDYKIVFQRLLLQKNINFFRKKSLYTFVHLFGQPHHFSKYINNHNFIEDACQSFGAEYKGKKVGTLGRIGCFSFYPTKMLHTCGHGGAVVTNNKEDYLKMKVFIESGRVDGIMTESIALNLRMDEIKAEYLLFELKDYDKKIETQRQIAYEFIKLVKDDQPFLEEEINCRHIYSIFNLIVKNRPQFRNHMKKYGIQTMIYYDESILPSNQRLKYTDITSSIVAIPCRWNLTLNEINTVKKALKSWHI